MGHHIVSVKAYLVIFVALLCLTALTVAAAMVDMGPFNNAVALAIAGTKTMLVASIFMHLKFSPRILWLASGAGVFWLVIMMTFTLSDFETRKWQDQPLSWNPPAAEAPAHPGTGH